jgi:Protein of unknown function (DUF1552)
MSRSRNLGTPRWLSRRAVLRGAGVALALPWLESLLPRAAQAQASRPPARFLPIYLPNGAPDIWKPQTTGVGAAWTLSSMLEQLTPLKSQVTVLSGLENGSVFNADGSPFVEPAHGTQPGAWLTCEDAIAVAKRLGVQEANGISVDQIMATHPAFAGTTPLASLQVGLSTTYSSCDGRQCSNSRSVSWKAETKPLYKLVDPTKVFNLLAGVTSTVPPGQTTPNDRAADNSVLDAVLESASSVRPKLSAHDKLRMDEFLDSVRAVEQRVNAVPPMPAVCQGPAAPNYPEVTPDGIRQTTPTYDKGTHANLMNDLVAWAFQCNLTRVVSYMLEDEDSEFVYDNVPLRHFTATSSTPATGVCGDYSSAQHGQLDSYATITWWNVDKVSQLCQKLAQLPEANGRSVLDNSVIFLGSCMHGSNHSCFDLPSLLVGGGGGALKTDQHLDLGNRPMRDLYFTLMNGVFDLGVTDFGVNRTGKPLAMIDQLLKT